MLYSFIAKYQEQPTHISIKKRLSQLWFDLNGALSSCAGMRRLLGTHRETAKAQCSAEGAGAELVQSRAYNASLLVERRIKKTVLNVYTSLGCIWKDISKELVTLVPVESRVPWLMGERGVHCPFHTFLYLLNRLQYAQAACSTN